MHKRTASPLDVIVITLATVVGAGLVALVIGVPVHQNYFHPLAQLRREINVGDPCDIVALMFSRYYEQRRESREIHFHDGISHHDFRMSEVPAERHLSLYHWFFMDDLQLTGYLGL